MCVLFAHLPNVCYICLPAGCVPNLLPTASALSAHLVNLCSICSLANVLMCCSIYSPAEIVLYLFTCWTVLNLLTYCMYSLCSPGECVLYLLTCWMCALSAHLQHVLYLITCWMCALFAHLLMCCSICSPDKCVLYMPTCCICSMCSPAECALSPPRWAGWGLAHRHVGPEARPAAAAGHLWNHWYQSEGFR